MVDQADSPARSLTLMAIYVIIGIPMVAYLWDVLNEFLALEFRPMRFLIAVPVGCIFALYLRFVSRKLREAFQPATRDLKP